MGTRAFLLLLSRFWSEHQLASILLIGIIARIILIPISAHPFDTYCWYSASMNILRDGPLNVQGFPPLWYHYMTVPVAYVYDWLSRIFSAGTIPMSSLPSALDFYPSYNIQYVPGMLFNSVVKFPFLLSDILVTLLLYKIVEELTKNKRLAASAALLWFLNPYLIWISAGWGMWDTLPALFSLASFFLLLKKRIVLSSVCLSLGLASKLYPALFLLPITIYFVKTGSADEQWKNPVRFHLVFLATSLLLFLPSIGGATSFFIRRFALSSTGITEAAANPVVKPVGFGLTYWSVYLLNRLFNIPIGEDFVFFLFVGSWALVVFLLSLTYWKISKLTFQMPSFDLAAAMLACVLALFLSYRGICEQWFVWALPFLILLCVAGRAKATFYWGASLVALLYSVLNCPLPFFFLPLAPWIGNNLLGVVYAIWAVEPVRIVILAILGCLFSFLMLRLLLSVLRSAN